MKMGLTSDIIFQFKCIKINHQKIHDVTKTLFFPIANFYLFMFYETFAYKDLGETTVLACEMFTSSFLPWLKHVAC